MHNFRTIFKNEKVMIQRQDGETRAAMKDDHYRITVLGEYRRNNEWERHYVRRMDWGSEYENRAMEVIAEILSR